MTTVPNDSDLWGTEVIDPEREPRAVGDVFTRPQPKDMDAERATLGGMLGSVTAIADVLEIIKDSEVYYYPAHQIVHEAIVDLYSQGKPADPITVSNYLAKSGDLSKIGGPGYLHTLYSSSPTSANAEHYAEIVRERAVLRRMVEVGTRIANMGYNPDGDASSLLDAAQADLDSISDGSVKTDYAPLGELMSSALDEIHAIGERGEGLTGIPTGYKDLDQLTNGFQAGQMIVVAARPAMGKSTIAVDVARTASIRHSIPGAIFSLEMSANEICMRLLSAESRVALHHMRSGTVTDDDWTRMARRLPDITAAPLYIDDSPNLTMTDIRTKIRKLVQDHGIQYAAIDYLQLMQAGGKRNESRQQEVSDMSRTIKLIGKEFGIPIIALSQLNRGPEQRQDKMPQVSDLRESGSIEQDADIVMLLHREDAYDKESPRSGEADIIVGKHRNGPTATITVAFQGHYSRFVDMAQT